MSRPFSITAFRRAWESRDLTLRELAEQMGVSVQTLQARARQFGFGPRAPVRRRLLDGHEEEMLRMRALGMSNAAIGEVFGAHWMTVLVQFRRLRAPSRGSGRRGALSAVEYLALREAGVDPGRAAAARDQLLLRMVAADVSRADIARVLGCHKSSVTKRARALGAARRRSGGQRRTTLAEFAEMELGARMARAARRAG